MRTALRFSSASGAMNSTPKQHQLCFGQRPRLACVRASEISFMRSPATISDACVQRHAALADFAHTSRYSNGSTAFCDCDGDRQIDGMSHPAAGDGKGDIAPPKKGALILIPQTETRKVTKVSMGWLPVTVPAFMSRFEIRWLQRISRNVVPSRARLSTWEQTCRCSGPTRIRTWNQQIMSLLL